MPHRLARSIALALAITTPMLATSCRPPGPPMRRLDMPQAGVPLRWELETGHALVGHVRVGSTRQIEGMARPLDQSLECDVTLQVLPPARDRKGMRLRASFSNIDLDWAMPPTADYSSDDFVALVDERLRKWQPWIDLESDGSIVATSPIPADAPADLRELFVAVMDALEASFVVLPAKAARRGETWADTRTRPIDDGAAALTIETRGKVEGLYRLREREIDVVVLEVDTHKRSAAGTVASAASQRDGRARVLFATAGYVAELDQESQAFASDAGMAFGKIRAHWRRTREIVPELVGSSDEPEDVQVITDPCNPDYVGPKACDEPAAPPPAKPAVPEPAAPDDADDETTGSF